VKLVNALAAKHDPPLVPRLLTGFGAKRSKSFYPDSSFTACVMDVAVGNIDLCIGNFWMTVERLAMGVDFVQPFGHDDFYVFAPIVWSIRSERCCNVPGCLLVQVSGVVFSLSLCSRHS